MKVPSKSHPLFILEAKKSKDRTTRSWCVGHSSTWWASLKCGIAWGWFFLRGWQLRTLHAMNCHLYFVYAQQLDNKSFCRAFIQLSSFIHCSTSIRRERRHIFKFFGLVSPMPTTTSILIRNPICLFSFETSGEQTRFIWSFERSTLGEGFLEFDCGFWYRQLRISVIPLCSLHNCMRFQTTAVHHPDSPIF